MQPSNPYAAPRAEVADVAATGAIDFPRMNRAAAAQKWLIYSLLASIVAVAFRANSAPQIGTLLSVLASLVSIVSVVRLDRALGGSVVSRVLYAIAMLLPLINLIIMVTLNVRATQTLRAAGYTVGLLGARQRPAA